VRALILHDDAGPEARPDEQDTLVQVRAVEAALVRLGATCGTLAFGDDLAAAREALRAAAPDVVFNLVESVAREGRLAHVAPAVLAGAGLPYTGSTAEALFLSTSKLLSKRVLTAAGLPTPAWRTARDLSGGGRLPEGRWILKSVWEHGSLGLEAEGVVATRDAGELRAALLARTPLLGGEAFAEAYVEGREFNAALLAGPRGVECLPIPEIRFEGFGPGEPRIVGYAAKWAPGSARYEGTGRTFDAAPADAGLHDELRRLALATWHAFELDGAARVDFRVDERGRPFVIDVNANPCLSPDAGFAATLARAGIAYEEAVGRLLAAGLARAGAGAAAAGGRAEESAACAAR
jgi:D-alanine-D-alanine ligase